MSYTAGKTEATIQKARRALTLKGMGQSYQTIADDLGCSTSRVGELLKNAKERKLRRSPMTALGAYIFAGGFTRGVMNHFKVVAQLELGPYGVESTRANFPDLPVHTDPETWPVDELRDSNIQFIYGNPPCAPWSQAGVSSAKQQRDYTDGYDPSDARVSYVFSLFSLLERLRPAVWAWESVPQAGTKGLPLILSLAQRAAGMGYACTLLWHNALHLGVAQNRKRVFIVFHRVEIPWADPRGLHPYPTVTEAFATLPDQSQEPSAQYRAGEKEMAILRQTKQGEKLRDVWNRLHSPEQIEAIIADHGRAKGRPGFLKRRLDPNRASQTILGGATYYHPDENRYITVPETKVLCGYPQEHVLVGSVGMQYQQVAQAVMPVVGDWLAGQVAAALANPKRVG